MDKVQITSVTPVYADKEFLFNLVGRLKELRATWEKENAPMELIEAIFVNDASLDGSLDVLYGYDSRTRNYHYVFRCLDDPGKKSGNIET